MKMLTTLMLIIATVSLTACDQETMANRGFSLPEGDAENGQLVFIELRCIQCHTLAGTDLSDEEWRLDGTRETSVELGGESTRLQTYGDLVTSIINPSHRIAKGYKADEVMIGDESKMLNYNDVMRVSELIDLVTFLKSKYVLQSVPLTTYPYYIYPG
ncbi:MAG: cytochrome C [Gammaproteobacteria bacterium]|nr:cytochrome C [Gammaproteobacteria bacterium]